MIGDYIHNKFDTDSGVRKISSPQKTNELSRLNTDKEPILTKEQKEKHSGGDETPDKYSKVGKGFTIQIKEKIQELKEFIGGWDHVPEFLKDNEFIHTGYRIGFSTPKKIFKSLFMVHNESVNIWSHLGGAIILIILSIMLCLSVSSINTVALEKQVSDLFKPIYDDLPNFNDITHDISEKITMAKTDLTRLSGDTINNLETKLEQISKEIENVKSNINPAALGNLLTTVKEQLDNFGDTFDGLKNSVSVNLNQKKLEELSNKLKTELDDLQDQIVKEIDSADFDWIDIYKYINPEYAMNVQYQNKGQNRYLSRWPIIVFLMTAVFCLLCSAIFHLCFCLSERANQIFLRFDYAGISILITGSCFPPLVYGFFCQPFFAKLYLSLIGGTSIIVFFVSLTDFIHTRPYLTIKSAMYGGLGIFAGLPLIHLVYLNFTNTDPNVGLDFSSAIPYYLAMGVSYLGGLTIYSHKCPERYNPGKFDICGHSHQIWHVCVLLGIVFTYLGSFDNYYNRSMHMQCPA